MGVVQHHREGGVHRHRFHPALHHGGAQTPLHGVVGQLQNSRHGDGRQCVGDAEPPRHGHLVGTVDALRPGGGKGHSQQPRPVEQFKIRPGPPVGGMIDAVGHHPAGMLGQDGLRLRVVGIHQPHPAAAEQHALPGAVLREAGVLARADVVGGKVGEHPDVVLNAGDPVHLEPQAGHLHDAGVAARLHHAAQQPLEVAALGGGVVQRMMVSRPAHPVGADQPHFAPGGRQHGGNQVGGGGLALGAGDADHRQLSGRFAVEPDGQPGQCFAAVGNLEHRKVGGQTRHRPLTDNTRRARRGSLPGVGVAVGVLAGQTDKQSPRRHGAGIVTQGLCFGAGVALEQDAVGDPEKLTQIHAASLPKNCPYQTRKQ